MARNYTSAKYHADGGGLYLCVGKSGGSCSWVYRYMLDGKAREMGLGAYPTISLADAREAAGSARKLKVQGTDPIADYVVGSANPCGGDAVIVDDNNLVFTLL